MCATLIYIFQLQGATAPWRLKHKSLISIAGGLPPPCSLHPNNFFQLQGATAPWRLQNHLKVKNLGNAENLKGKDPPGEHFLFYEFFPNLLPWGTYCSNPKSEKTRPKSFELQKSKFWETVKILGGKTPLGNIFCFMNFFPVCLPGVPTVVNQKVKKLVPKIFALKKSKFWKTVKIS